MQVTLKAANGRYITAEEGGGTTLSVNRTQAGPWETWEVEERGSGLFALKSCDGYYLGVDPYTSELTIDRTEVGEWEEWVAVPGETDGSVALQSVFTGLFIHALEGGDAGLLVSQDADHIHAWESFISEPSLLKVGQPELPSEPAPTQALRLKGPLRVVNKTFVDDNGPVFPFFASYFPIMAVARKDRAVAARIMEKIAALYPGFRTFFQVGGWTPYWDGLEVNLLPFAKWFFDPNNGGHTRPAALGRTVPAWPIDEFLDTLRFVLRTCRSLGIRLDITFGDMQILCPDYNRELQIHDQISRVVQEEGGTEVAALVEGCNEFPINHRGGDSQESMDQLAKVLRIWERNVPGILTAEGAIIDDARLQLSTQGSVVAAHIDRSDPETHLKHTFGSIYWEGDWHHLEDAVWFTEPMGPGKDSYQPSADPAFLTALYLGHGLMGCASSFFEGGAVRGTEELDSVWGFKELPEIARQLLPRDVHLWSRMINRAEKGVMYWVNAKEYELVHGKEFRAILFKTWNPAPPAEVDEWSLHAGTSIRTGKGNPPPGMTGILYGKFK